HLLSTSSFSSHCAAHRPLLPSFPTRRSSDLSEQRLFKCRRVEAGTHEKGRRPRRVVESLAARRAWRSARRSPVTLRHRLSTALRSEEHTSELQSRFDLVCRLLLEKNNFYLYQ